MLGIPKKYRQNGVIKLDFGMQSEVAILQLQQIRKGKDEERDQGMGIRVMREKEDRYKKRNTHTPGKKALLECWMPFSGCVCNVECTSICD